MDVNTGYRFTNSPSAIRLKEYISTTSPSIKITDLFKKETERVSNHSITINTPGNFLTADLSKNLVDEEAWRHLYGLLEESGFEKKRAAMFAGEHINTTEDRPALHTALRSSSQEPLIVDGEDVRKLVSDELNHIKDFSKAVRSGEHRGYTNKRITDLVNLGIGGSDLGPLMVVQSLAHYSDRSIRAHFVSNVDATHIMETLRGLDPETTLFLIASKTFTTQETMMNARTARDWFVAKTNATGKDICESERIAKHFIALSTNETEVTRFNINPRNMFKFWNWVGGRYSVWSSIGLSIAICIGFDHFKAFLEGAEAMDQHFLAAKPEENLPVRLALLGILYNNFYGFETHAILPYDQYLSRFAAYFQQGDMESNGKCHDLQGNLIQDYQTGPIIWGEPGTNGQHAFYQLIHQGTKTVPCDFIMPINSLNTVRDHHLALASNFFAQTEALMRGKDLATARAEVEQAEPTMKPETRETRETLARSKVFPGNKPTNTILIGKLSPHTLGMLIAMYEMKIFTMGVVWNINSFDQMGVELGKQLAKAIFKELEDLQHPDKNEGPLQTHDPSTNHLLTLFRAHYVHTPTPF